MTSRAKSFCDIFYNTILLVCLHDQNKSGFFGRSAFIQPIRAIEKVFKKL